MRHLMGEPGRAPVRAGVSLGDTLAALHGVIGVLLALQARARTGRGQVVDVALFEAVFNCMESLLPEYSAFGAVREPAGSALPGIAPSNAYRCADGQVVIGATAISSIYRRLMSAIGRADLAEAPDLSNAGRVARVDEIDAAITQWTVQRPVDAVVAALQAVQVPVGRIYTVRDIAADPHYRARQMIERIVTADGLALEVPGVVPELGDTPGGLFRPAPRLGEHDGEGMSAMTEADDLLPGRSRRAGARAGGAAAAWRRWRAWGWAGRGWRRGRAGRCRRLAFGSVPMTVPEARWRCRRATPRGCCTPGATPPGGGDPVAQRAVPTPAERCRRACTTTAWPGSRSARARRPAATACWR